VFFNERCKFLSTVIRNWVQRGNRALPPLRSKSKCVTGGVLRPVERAEAAIAYPLPKQPPPTMITYDTGSMLRTMCVVPAACRTLPA
jgi:hypothetical protein